MKNELLTTFYFEMLFAVINENKTINFLKYLIDCKIKKQ